MLSGNNMAGRYELLHQIAQGGMAEVYLARSRGAEGVEKVLVIKKILADQAKNQRFTKMFVSEAWLALKLNHPNIVQTYDFGADNGIYYIAMEYIDGDNLSNILLMLPAEHHFPLGEALFMGIELCKGLDYAHRRVDEFGAPMRIVHCDISPHNIMVSREGDLKIVDFGIAKAIREAGVKNAEVLGKYHYMSREQALGLPLDHRTDIFSATAVIFELITGKKIYDFVNAPEILSAAREGALVDIDEAMAGFSLSLRLAIKRGLEIQPENRYQTIRELQVELYKELRELSGIHDARTVSDYIRTYMPKEHTIENTNTIRERVLKAFNRRYMENTSDTRQNESFASYYSKLKHWVDGSDAIPKILIGVCCRMAGNGLGLKDSAFYLATRELLENIISKYGGILHHFSSDKIVVFLGVTSMATDDISNAVFMALDFREAMFDLFEHHQLTPNFAFSVMNVKASTFRSPAEGIVEITLDEENEYFLDSLADLAPRGEILITGRIKNRIDALFDTHFLMREYVNRSEVRCYTLINPKSDKQKSEETSSGYDKIYGRENILAEIRFMLSEVRRRERAHCYCLLGPVGIGKSVLLAEFSKRFHADVATEEGFGKIVHIANVKDSQKPLFCMSDLVARALGCTHGNADCVGETESERFDYYCDREPEDKARLKSVVFELLKISSQTDMRSGISEKTQIYFEACLRLFDDISTKKVPVIVIDNFHLVDGISMMIIKMIVERAKFPIFFLLASVRFDSPIIQTMGELKNFTLRHVEPISVDDAENLLTSRLNGTPASEKLKNYIVEKSMGRPFFILELIRALESKDYIEKVNGEYELSDRIPASWIPSTLEGVISEEFDRLDEDMKESIVMLSVFGFDFVMEVVVTIFGHDIVDIVDRLIQEKVLRHLDGEDIGGIGSVQFSHELFYHIVAPLSEELKYRQVRLKYIEVMLAVIEAEKNIVGFDCTYSDVARQYALAGMFDKAALYYAKDANILKQHLLPQEAFMAAATGREALKRCNKDSENRRLNNQLEYQLVEIQTWSYKEIGNLSKYYEYLNYLRGVAIESSVSEHIIPVSLNLSEYHIDNGQLEQALLIVDSILASQNSSPDDKYYPYYCEAIAQKATICNTLGQFDKSLALLEDNIAKAGTGNKFVVDLIRRKGDTYFWMADFENAIVAFRQALMLCDDLSSRFNLFLELAKTLVELGRYSDAFEIYAALQKSPYDAVHKRRLTILKSNLGELYAQLGDWFLAEKTLVAAINEAKLFGDVQTEAESRNRLISIYIQQKKFHLANILIVNANDCFESCKQQQQKIFYQLKKAEIACFGKKNLYNPELALKLALSAAAAAKEIFLPKAWLHGYHIAALSYEALEQNENALIYSDKTVEDDFISVSDRQERILYSEAQLRMRLEPENIDKINELFLQAHNVVIQKVANIREDDFRESFMSQPWIDRITILKIP